MNERGVAIIPARGGSKGIPRKNIMDLCQKPMIYYSIKAALESRSISGCFVSTEDAEIAAVSLKYGAKVIDRPAELAGDLVSTFDVVKHAVEYLGSPDVVVVLQPTSPLRRGADIDEAFELFKEDVSAVVGVCEFHGYMWSEKDNGAAPLFKERLPRQKMDKLYVENGALYITRKEVFLRNDSRLGMGIPSSGKIRLFHMDKKHSVEMDTKDDLAVIEDLLRRDHGDSEDKK